MSNIVISKEASLSEFHKKEISLIQKFIEENGTSFIFNYNPILGFYINGNCSSAQYEFHNLIILISESYRGFYKFIPTFENKIKIRCSQYVDNFKNSDEELKLLITNFYKVFYETNLSSFLTEDELNCVSFIRDKNFLELSRIYNQIQ